MRIIAQSCPVRPTALGFALLAAVAPAARAAAIVDPKTPKPLDGVIIEAVETYVAPKTSALKLGVGIYPFNAYYNDLALSLGYNYRISQTWGWDILEAGYFIPFRKDLTSQLADKYNVNPESIEKLQYIVTTNIVFTHTYGKFLFMEDYIRYFRSAFFLGGGLVSTTQESTAAANLGARFEFFHGDSFAWIFDIRDAVTISGVSYVTFSVGSGFNF